MSDDLQYSLGYGRKRPQESLVLHSDLNHERKGPAIGSSGPRVDEETGRRRCLLLSCIAFHHLRDKFPATCLIRKTQRLIRKPAFSARPMSREPQCVETSLTPRKRMSLRINRLLCSRTKGALSSENSSSAVPPGDCAGVRWVCVNIPNKRP